MKRTLVVSAVLAMMTACGGSATPESTTPTPTAQSPDASHDGEAQHPHEHGDDKGAEHHHEFPAEMKAFHDLLSPVWHSDPGAERIKTACDANDAWVNSAGGVVEGPVPAGVDEQAWKQGAHDLGAAVEDFGRVCESDQAEAEKQLKAIHDGFHVLLDLLEANKK